MQEEIILTAKDRSLELEYQLFLELRKTVSKSGKSLQILADQIAYIDVIQALAEVALKTIILNQN